VLPELESTFGVPAGRATPRRSGRGDSNLEVTERLRTGEVRIEFVGLPEIWSAAGFVGLEPTRQLGRLIRTNRSSRSPSHREVQVQLWDPPSSPGARVGVTSPKEVADRASHRRAAWSVTVHPAGQGGSRTVRRRPRCRTGRSALMRGGRAASARLRRPTVDGVRDRSRNRTGVTGFADRFLTTRTCGHAYPRRDSNSRHSGSEPGALSTELRGRGGSRGIRTLSATHLLYRQARLSNVGALPWGGCRGSNPDRESHNLACTAGTPQPPCRNTVPERGVEPRTSCL
jgi:hypothetical protein